jgi:hypothetical protein
MAMANELKVTPREGLELAATMRLKTPAKSGARSSFSA